MQNTRYFIWTLILVKRSIIALYFTHDKISIPMRNLDINFYANNGNVFMQLSALFRMECKANKVSHDYLFCNAYNQSEKRTYKE